MTLFQLKRSINQSDYRFFGLIFLYAVYNLVRNYIFTSIDSESGNYLPLLLFILDIIQWLLILSIFFVSVGRNTWKVANWGLIYNKQLWIGVALIILAIVYSSKYIPQFIIGDIWRSMQITLNITFNELVMRAALIGYLIGILGKSKKGIFLSILTSSVLYAIVMAPVDPLTAYSVVRQLVFACIYYYLGSILLNVFCLSAYFGSNELISYTGVVVIVLYFILMLSARQLRACNGRKVFVGNKYEIF